MTIKTQPDLEKKTGRHFSMTLQDPVAPEDLAEILPNARLRPTAENQGGMIFTSSYLQGLWNLESGYDDCADPGCVRHREYSELTEQQRQHFAKLVAGWLQYQLSEHFLLEEQVAPVDRMTAWSGTALGPHE